MGHHKVVLYQAMSSATKWAFCWCCTKTNASRLCGPALPAGEDAHTRESAPRGFEEGDDKRRRTRWERGETEGKSRHDRGDRELPVGTTTTPPCTALLTDVVLLQQKSYP